MQCIPIPPDLVLNGFRISNNTLLSSTVRGVFVPDYHVG